MYSPCFPVVLWTNLSVNTVILVTGIEEPF